MDSALLDALAETVRELHLDNLNRLEDNDCAELLRRLTSTCESSVCRPSNFKLSVMISTVSAISYFFIFSGR